MSLTIEKQKAKRLYPEAPDWFKKDLDAEFGEDFFKASEFESIRTFEDACKKMNAHPDDVFHERDSPDEIAYKKLKLITRAINNGWTPDWDNSNQRKWFPWFTLSSGFGFDLSYCNDEYTGPAAGSRLCFESEEKATFAGQQFLEIYREFLTITK